MECVCIYAYSYATENGFIMKNHLLKDIFSIEPAGASVSAFSFFTNKMNESNIVENRLTWDKTSPG